MSDLTSFGFTTTEDRVYIALLGMAPATGYAIARAAGLARANAYAALEALARRGVATRLPGRPARWVGEDPDALVERLTAESRRHLEQLGRSLASVGRTTTTDVGLIEVLSGQAAVLDRVSAWAGGAREELLGVVGPWASDVFESLAPSRRARVTTRVLSLGTPGPPGAVVRAVPREEIARYWGGLPIALVVDRRRALCAILQASETSGVATTHPAVVPFLRHLLRRELAAGQSPGSKADRNHGA